VQGSDGEKIGVVNKVVENPSVAAAAPGRFYFEVDRGGFLGVGATHLYIPVETVTSTDDGVITLSCTANTASEKYKHEPS
jgi:hypothetical protein